MANLSKIAPVDLLQEGVSAALSILFAIEAGEMLHALPADQADAVKHNHALRMLDMLNDSLLLIQAEIDGRDAQSQGTRVSDKTLWDKAVINYCSAKAAENVYANHHFARITDANASSEISALSQQVLDRARFLEKETADAEDALMAIPSPTAAAFALKYTVAFGGGRETDCWDAMLEAEAKRFAKEA